MALLEINNLTVDYGAKRAIDNISMHVNQGEIISVVGESGCGKTTLIKVIAGLLPVTSGQVLMDGKVVTKAGPDRMVLWQEVADSLLPWKTVESNVVWPLILSGVPKKQALAKAHEWLEKVGLSKWIKAYCHELSGGMRQRVAIARGLAANAKLLIMDEPFSALDGRNREVMQEELLAIQTSSHTTIIIITHDAEEAARLSDRVIVLSPNPGRVKAELAGANVTEDNIRGLIRETHREIRRVA